MLADSILILLPVVVLLQVGFTSGALFVWAFRVNRPTVRRTGA